MNILKIAVVGPGLMGSKHLELIAQEPGTCVGAIVAPDHDENILIASKYHVPLYHEIDSLLAQEAIDGAIVSSPNIFHFDQAAAFLQARIPVLVEKPIAHTYEAGKRLVEIAAKTGVPLMVGHHRAHSPIMNLAKEIIQSNRLGRLVAVIGSALFYKPKEYFDAGPWRKETGGGPILINLIHEIGNLRALCGEIASVQAISTSATRQFAVEDTVALNMEFNNGALGVFMLSDTAASARSWEQTSRENPSFPAYDDEDCYLISGTRGTLAIPSMRLKMFGGSEPSSWWSPMAREQFSVKRDDPLKRQLSNFANVIRGTDSALVPGPDGLQNLRVVEAIIESIKRQSLVHL